MAKASKPRSYIVPALFIFGLFGVFAMMDVTGVFSVTGAAGLGEPEYMEHFNVSQECVVLSEVSSLRNAPQELGVERFYELTSTGSLTSDEGMVYYCR